MKTYTVTHEALVKLLAKLPEKDFRSLATIRTITGCSLDEARELCGKHCKSQEYIEACHEVQGYYDGGPKPDKSVFAQAESLRPLAAT